MVRRLRLNRSVAVSAACVAALCAGCGVEKMLGLEKTPAPAPMLPPSIQATTEPATRPATGPSEVVERTDYARRIAELLEKRRLAATQPVTRPATQSVVQATPPTMLPAVVSPAPATAPSPTTVPAMVPATIPVVVQHRPATVPAVPLGLGVAVQRQAKADPQNLAAVLSEQLYELLQDRPVPNRQVVAELSTEDKQIADALLGGLKSFRQQLKTGGPEQMQGTKVQPLLDMADQIRALAPLKVPTVALCTRVDGYGVYEPIDPARFPAGRESSVVLYCEVSGFTSRQGDRRMWETRLSEEVELYGEQGQVAWRDKSNSIVDQSRNRRRDFFIARIIHLPGMLAEGKYVLKVTVSDQLANKVAEATLAVQVAK